MDDIYLDDIFDKIIGTTKETFELLKDGGSDIISVYMFYYYTGKWQKTNQARATVDYVANGLNISKDRVRKAREYLKKIGLIEDVQMPPQKGNKSFGQTYVKLKFMFKKATLQDYGKQECGKQDYGKQETNALSKNNKMLKEKNNKMLKELEKKSKDFSIIKKINLGEKIKKEITPELFIGDFTKKEDLESELLNFHNYWTEGRNKKNGELIEKWEDEKYFEINKRFRTWVNNSKKFNKKPTNNNFKIYTVK